MAATRVCSLLPSSTEIVSALGAADRLVAVTHECDYPEELASIAKVTSSVIDPTGMSEAEIDAAIRRSLQNLSTIYFIDREQIAELQPDLIITQELCEVCAVSFRQVCEVADTICPGARVLSLEPESLEGILESIMVVGDSLELATEARRLVRALRSRVQTVRERTDQLPRPSVMAVEWLDPPFTGGHWVPEMIEAAGGESALAEPGKRSRQLTWEEIAEVDPDIMVLMPCGYDLEATLESATSTPLPSAVRSLRCVVEGNVFAVNGSAYFNRPGPRVIDGIEQLASILHPEEFGAPDPNVVQRLSREDLA